MLHVVLIYEMLSCFRYRRYKLKQVMVDGDLPPSLKKDAHDIILEFIRSRPPLKPVRNPVKTGFEILLKTFINITC